MCCSELKTQNAFAPETKDEVQVIDMNEQEGYSSPAVCQLDDVDAIMKSENGDTFKMTIDGSCVVTINPKDTIILDTGTGANIFESEFKSLIV